MIDISVVIPTYNRKSKLAACLEALFRQDFPADRFEIIVVDDGSHDGTVAMLQELAVTRHSLRVLRQDHGGPAAARNRGIRQAQAGIVCFTDTDCLPERSWLSVMWHVHQQRPEVFAVGGRTCVKQGNVRARVSQSLSDGAIYAKIGGKDTAIFFPTCNIALKKTLLEGMFDEAFPLPAGEDLDFCWRSFKKGLKLYYDECALVLHDCHDDHRSFCAQAYKYGRGNYLVQQRHKDHPLLKEIRVGGDACFLAAWLINWLKIPRFSFNLGRTLIRKGGFTLRQQVLVYFYFVLHKAAYLVGNLVERRRVSGADAAVSAPDLLILDTTHRCNLECRICDIRKDEHAPELETSLVCDLLDQARKWGVRDCVFSGGEALLRKDIFQLLEHVRGRKYRVGVLTNATIIDRVFFEKLSPYLIDGCLSLCVSLDSLKPVLHDFIRGKDGAFDRTFTALSMLSGLKRQFPAVNFNVITIVLNENLEELTALAEAVLQAGANSLQFQPLLANNLVMHQRSSDAVFWVPAERYAVLDRSVDALVEFKRKNPEFVRNSETNLLLIKKYFRGCLVSGDIRCANGSRTMLVANNGDVTTCFECYGTVRNKGLSRIFASERAARARARAAACTHPCLLPCFTDTEPL